MRIEKVDLTAKIGDLLSLNDPFWIASCHLTTKESGLNAWQQFEPAALTLKSCTQDPETEEKDTLHVRLADSLQRFGLSTYCDGPKQQELLSYKRAVEVLEYGKEHLPKTKVGLSVLARDNEDYAMLAGLGSFADFCELNLKYSFRVSSTAGTQEWLKAAEQNLERIETQIDAFCHAFKDMPVFLKLPREMTWLPGTAESQQILGRLAKHGKAGIIIGNSLRAEIPEFVDKGEEKGLRGGVICGEHLYDSTITLIERFRDECQALAIPIVASGGMIGEDQIINALRKGAKAVQLCTAFDYFRTHYYRTLRSSLRARIHAQGLKTFEQYSARLPFMGIASIQNIPFLYFERFYSEEAQDTLLDDVVSSSRMDVSVLSGYTLFRRWRQELKTRFEKNLGMRLFMPDPESEIYRTVQLSWGITIGAQMDARKDHLKLVVDDIKQLWNDTKPKRDMTRGEEKEVRVEIVRHSQCPFDSMYVFDGKVYVAPYPLVWQEEFASPVYAFFGRTLEYERRSADLEQTYVKAKHTSAVETLP